LKKIPGEFDAAHKRVIDDCTYAHAYKVAWESRRFWEQDYNIYGGLEFVNVGCSPVWFPSGDFFKERGVFVSGYTDARGPFEALTLEQKFAESRKTIDRLHPGHGKEASKPLFVNWGKIPYQEGSWIDTYEPGEKRDKSHVTDGAASGGLPAKSKAGPTVTRSGYATLMETDGPIFFTGDHVSHLVGWQEGAAEASHRVVGMINERAKARKA
jgi:monoamine oxidase